MKDCPHCGKEIAELAAVCPHCRAVVDPDKDLVARIIVSQEPASDSTPDHASYILVGSILLIIGTGLVLANSDETEHGSAEAIGGIIWAIGAMAMFVGLVGLGVYIGMRQFDSWQRGSEEPGRD